MRMDPAEFRTAVTSRSSIHVLDSCTKPCVTPWYNKHIKHNKIKFIKCLIDNYNSCVS